MMDFALPAMSPARIDALVTELKKASVYLEFGMGGSTVLAARLGVPNVFAVDSSIAWLNHVAEQISQVKLSGSVNLLHADLGATGDWGYPKSNEKLENWTGYYSGPWRAARAAGVQPDLVLVDGRFRVACFLYSLLQMREGGVVLWDDYANRPEYHSVERFLKPSACHDEMAVFQVTGRENVPGIVDALFSGLYVVD